MTDEQIMQMADRVFSHFDSKAQADALLFARDIIAAHEATKPGWQPMGTAPKDGTNILLLNDKGNMAAGMWLNGVLGAGWFLRGGNEPDYFFNNHRGPTHWMPLPAAPDHP
jgi:hypothetical protein